MIGVERRSLRLSGRGPRRGPARCPARCGAVAAAASGRRVRRTGCPSRATAAPRPPRRRRPPGQSSAATRQTKYQPVSDGADRVAGAALGQPRPRPRRRWTRPTADARVASTTPADGERPRRTATTRRARPRSTSTHAPARRARPARARPPAAPTTEPLTRRRARRPRPRRRTPCAQSRAAATAVERRAREPGERRSGRTTCCGAAAQPSRERAATVASKQVRSPVWQAGPSWSTLTSSGVAVAVEPDLLDVLAVAGGLALDPVLLARAAPERRTPGGRACGAAPRRPSSRPSAPRPCRAAARPRGRGRRRRA